MGSEDKGSNTGETGEMGIFRPPIIRNASVLNRALFSKRYDIAAARVYDIKKVSEYRKSLEKSGDLLRQERVSSIVDDPTKDDQAAKGRKCLLLRPGISATGKCKHSHLQKKETC